MSIPANVLAAIRAAATASLDVPGIQIQSATTTTDSYGHTSTTWATTATVSGGWAKPTAAVMAEYAGRIGTLASWMVRLPYGTSIRNGDRLLMPSGDVLLVQADLSQSSYSSSVRVLATEFR